MLNFDLKVVDPMNQLICTFDVDCSEAWTRSLHLPVPYLCGVLSSCHTKLNQRRLQRSLSVVMGLRDNPDSRIGFGEHDVENST